MHGQVESKENGPVVFESTTLQSMKVAMESIVAAQAC
jgi:hypothetical protein